MKITMVLLALMTAAANAETLKHIQFRNTGFPSPLEAHARNIDFDLLQNAVSACGEEKNIQRLQDIKVEIIASTGHLQKSSVIDPNSEQQISLFYPEMLVEADVLCR
jgi:hypothetical protein